MNFLANKAVRLIAHTAQSVRGMGASRRVTQSPWFLVALFVFAPVLDMLVVVRNVQAQQLAFVLPDHSGTDVAVEPGTSKLTAVCFLGTQCPMAKAYAGSLSQLQSDFASQGVHVVGVMSNRQDSLSDVNTYIEETGASFDIVIDQENQVADRYGATRTPEVYLLDEQLKLRYHGRIDDQYVPGVAKAAASREDLRMAIEELLSGKQVSIRETTALGCIIGRVKTDAASGSMEDTSLTFSRDVFPILRRHCFECHRQGEIGPFAMDSYDEVVGWADTMMETIDDGRMPPWHAESGYGEFVNARSMPREDKELLREWIKAGAPRGEPLDRSQIPARESGEAIAGWYLSEPPGVILPMRDRPYTVPKDGVVEYQYFVVDPNFTEDKWVKAAQVIPGSRDVVHHCLVFVRPPDSRRFEGVGLLTGYVPGQRPIDYPEGCATFIPAGSKLVFQMHYTPVGSERDDVTSVGIVFADDEEVTHRAVTLAALDQEFEIPPHAGRYTVSAALRKIPSEGQLLAVAPHMHVRGKRFELTAEFEDGSSETLLRVPNYDFNWQHSYHFAQPIDLAKLKHLGFSANFDNSKDNPFNPDPSEWVTWGDQTWEEMALALFSVSLPREMSYGDLYEEGRVDLTERERQSKIEKYIASALENLDSNGDGVIRKSEGDIVVRRRFWQWDLNEDSVVTKDELRQVAERLF